MASAYRHVFALSLLNTSEIDANMDQSIYAAKVSMKACWEGVRDISFAHCVNFHCAAHTGVMALRFGLPRLCSCARGEAKHGALKRVSRNCNHRHEEVDMMENQSVEGAISLLLQGGAKHFYQAAALYSDVMLNLFQSDFVRRLVALSGVTETYVGRDEESLGDSYPDIRFSGELVQERDPVVGTRSYRSAKPGSETFASEVRTGGFFSASVWSDGRFSEWVVRVDIIITSDESKDPCAQVVVLAEVGSHPDLKGPLLSDNAFNCMSLKIPLANVSRHVHVVPVCAAGSACAMQSPPDFACSCLAITTADHINAHTFLLNPYMVK